MIVFADATEQMKPSASQRDLAGLVKAARIAGSKVYTIPPDFERCSDADSALFHVPVIQKPVLAWWIGYIPSVERYLSIYEAAKARNIYLINSPEEHRRVLEFDRTYPLLEGLTAKTFVVKSVDECEEAVNAVGLPVFVKGAVQSRKSRGYKCCVAENIDQLRILCGQLFDLEQRSRGRVLVRELLPLRYCRRGPEGFPLGREFRVFLYKSKVLAFGYYWQGNDELCELTEHEKEEMLGVSIEGSQKIGSPLVCIDVGQCEDGRWVIIETNDPMFSGTSQMNKLELWHSIEAIEPS